MAANYRMPGREPLRIFRREGDGRACLTGIPAARTIVKAFYRHRPSGRATFSALPPRSMVGQLPLEQPIGVRIPGGQPMFGLSVVCSSPGMSEEVHLDAQSTSSFQIRYPSEGVRHGTLRAERN